MTYCSGCGSPLPKETAEAEAVAEAAHEEAHAEIEVSDREVEIARINAKRDIDLAKIQRGVIESEVVQEAEVATAEAEAVTEALTPEPPSNPVVVVSDPPTEDDQDMPGPPPADSSEPSETEPDQKPKSTGYGNPLFFG